MIHLSAQKIAALCRKTGRTVAVELVAETGSTNTDLLARVVRLDGPLLLIAESQTAGRGRAGRAWHSDPGAGLTFSLAWRFRLPLQALAGLPLAVGVALAKALALLDVEIRLKWPNDVLKDGNKLAGILIETAPVAGTDQAIWAVIGVGLNLAIPQRMRTQMSTQMSTQLGCPAALPALDCNLLMAALLDGLSEALLQFEAAGFSAFAADWSRLHAYQGRQVSILDGGRILHEGVAIGVDNSGRLLLQTATGQVAVMAGDVSLRAQEG
jgi:BirA family biotin operon repressor/biotin-[acetyl-CoA-carboxylase] ligase